MPDPGLPAGRLLPWQAQSERTVTRVAEFPLAPVQRAAAEPSPDRVEASAPTSEFLQRDETDSVSSEMRYLSRAAEASSAVGTVGSAVGSISGGPHGSETDMDELAGKLYDKIRTRLKSELLVDRERAGFLTDLR
jgi:hypothetical protein